MILVSELQNVKFPFSIYVLGGKFNVKTFLTPSAFVLGLDRWNHAGYCY